MTPAGNVMYNFCRPITLGIAEMHNIEKLIHSHGTNPISKAPPVEISISCTQIRAPQSSRTFVAHMKNTENAVEDYSCKVMKKDRPRYGNGSDNQ